MPIRLVSAISSRPSLKGWHATENTILAPCGCVAHPPFEFTAAQTGSDAKLMFAEFHDCGRNGFECVFQRLHASTPFGMTSRNAPGSNLSGALSALQ
jgi:hypothetical protein